MIKNKKECFVVGTRPDIIKMIPLIEEMKPYVIHTGQHKELADEVFDIFDMKPDIDLKLMEKNQTLNGFISKSIAEIDKVVDKIKPTRIWVLGDTSSAYAAAIVAYTRKIELVHLEAGLRTHDLNNPFPEEGFRVMIDKMANILFAPTSRNVRNLKMEGIYDNVHQVGNTIVDVLKVVKMYISDSRPIDEPYVLLTMHRRESFDKDMDTVFKVIKKLSKKIKIIYPIHPNPNVRKLAKKYGLTTIKPLNYKDFMTYLKHCEYVISDSGGIQEEVPSFNKPILILRKTTERQEILKSNLAFISDLSTKDIEEKIKKISKIKNPKYKKNPFGDGNTTDRIIKIIKEKYE